MPRSTAISETPSSPPRLPKCARIVSAFLSDLLESPFLTAGPLWVFARRTAGSERLFTTGLHKCQILLLSKDLCDHPPILSKIPDRSMWNDFSHCETLVRTLFPQSALQA